MCFAWSNMRVAILSTELGREGRLASGPSAAKMRPVPTDPASADLVVRALTDDGSFRAIVASTTATVRGVVAAQGVAGRTARALGDLVTATSLVRETMAPQLRVQGIARGAGGRGTLVADSRPSGTVRGLVQGKAGLEFGFGEGSLLRVMRSLPNGSIHQGIIDTSEHAGLSEALMAYMQESEQVVCVAGVGQRTADSGEVVAAGGFLVQLLPEAERGVIAVMEQRLRDLPPIEELLAAYPDPRTLLGELFYGMPFAEVGASPIAYACECSLERLILSLTTLPREEIADILARGETLEVQCDYCQREYRIPPAALAGLGEPS
jgi:molecular chaperone Hsp33